MRVVIPCVGTRGDVQPYLALGRGLQAAGHEVRIVTMRAFETFVRTEGLDFAPVSAEFLDLLATPEGKKALAGGNPFGLLGKVMPMLRAMLDEVLEASRDADVIVYHPKTLASEHVAQALGMPAVLASVVPLLTPTSEFASPLVRAGRSMGGPLNRLSWNAVLLGVYAPYRKMIDEWRVSELGLPQASEQPPVIARTLYGFSEHLLPRPTDWPADVVVTGAWFLDSETGWSPEPELEAFLSDGPAPVYVGFGSMPSKDPQRVAAIVAEALRTAGVRGVVSSGLGGMNAVVGGGDILQIQAAPHAWLFPRMDAVVHHGGAGTTFAGLRAGRATLVVPTFGDQPFWGARVAQAGAGPAPIPAKRLNVERLAAAIRALVKDERMRATAQHLGAAIGAEHGVSRAVAEIEDVVGSR